MFQFIDFAHMFEHLLAEQLLAILQFAFSFSCLVPQEFRFEIVLETSEFDRLGGNIEN
jgi:hypothetical protein